jgi:hypothetical protein
VTDLYSRVTVGTKIIVLPNHGQADGKVAPTAMPVRVTAPHLAGLRTTGNY